MATELEGNLQLQRFIALLADLNHQSAAYLQSGNNDILSAMNKTVEDMYAIQRVGTEDAYTAIDDDMQAICKNFNAAVTMLQSNEKIRAQYFRGYGADYPRLRLGVNAAKIIKTGHPCRNECLFSCFFTPSKNVFDTEVIGMRNCVRQAD